MARDLTKGPIPRHVVTLAIPAVLSMFAVVANNFIDTALVGHLGYAELAAVGSAGFIIWIIFSLMDIFSVGALAIISRDYGAGDLESASRNSRSIYGFSIIFSTALAGLGIIFSKHLLGLLNLAPEVSRMGGNYLLIIFFAIPALFIGEVISTLFRAVGDAKTPMIVMIVAVGLNIVLDILLIYGVWIFPRLETVGAAVATAIAHSAAGGLAIYLAKRGKIPFEIFPKNLFDIDFDIIKKMFKIGIPIGAAHVNFAFVYLAMTRIMAEFGTPAVASIPVGNRAESISYMTCFGFYMAVSAMVGQNLGAKNPGRASKSVWISVGLTSVATFIFGLIFFLFDLELASILTDQSEVIGIAAGYLRILALSQIFMGFEFVFEGAFSGAGDTMPAMLVSVPGTLIRIPLAYYLAIPVGLGPDGIFWAITISTILKGLAILIWFRFAKWRSPEA